MVRSLIASMLLMAAGCASKSAANSCEQAVFRGGTVSDCGETVYFEPADGNPVAHYVVVEPHGRPLRILSQGLIVECAETEVHEGSWRICADGYSSLERTDQAALQAALARAKRATRP